MASSARASAYLKLKKLQAFKIITKQLEFGEYNSDLRDIITCRKSD